MTPPDRPALPKYLRVAAAIRRQIADGTLRPGQPAPSGAELGRAFGFSTLTCRKALRALIADGLLVPGPSPSARPRVADPQAPDLERDLAAAAAALSAGLAARRHAAGLTQVELAELARVSVTTVGHAETGRTWQSRQFWERADAALHAGGDLLRLHDAYRAANFPTHPARSTPDFPERTLPSAATVRAVRLGRADLDAARPAAAPYLAAARRDAAGHNGADLAAFQPDAAHPDAARLDAAVPVGPARIIIVWTDGTVTTVQAPDVRAAQPPATLPYQSG